MLPGQRKDFLRLNYESEIRTFCSPARADALSNRSRKLHFYWLALFCYSKRILDQLYALISGRDASFSSRLFLI